MTMAKSDSLTFWITIIKFCRVDQSKMTMAATAAPQSAHTGEENLTEGKIASAANAAISLKRILINRIASTTKVLSIDVVIGPTFVDK